MCRSSAGQGADMRTPCPNVRQRTKDAEVIVIGVLGEWWTADRRKGGQAGRQLGDTRAGGQADGRTGGKAERRMELLTSRLRLPPSRPTHAAWAPSAVGVWTAGPASAPGRERAPPSSASPTERCGRSSMPGAAPVLLEPDPVEGVQVLHHRDDLRAVRPEVLRRPHLIASAFRCRAIAALKASTSPAWSGAWHHPVKGMSFSLSAAASPTATLALVTRVSSLA